MNDRLLPKDKALVSVYDHGFLYGDGIYETLRVYKGIVFKIDEHIARLFRSASLIGLSLNRAARDIERCIYETLDANGYADAVIRISVSRGPGPLGLDPALCPSPTFVIMAHQFRPYPGHYYARGVNISVVETRRNYRKALDPRIKSLNFLNNIQAKREAVARNTYEAIMLNYRGYIAEGTVTNVFFAGENVLCTPSLDVGILDGITRAIILDVARGAGLPVREGKFRKSELISAAEIFISNTNMEVMPVAEVDGQKVRKAPGKVTTMIREGYRTVVSDYVRQGAVRRG